jgi:two-component system chemotaxis family response regulator WspR
MNSPADNAGIELPERSYDIVMLLVDDQPMIGEAVRRAIMGEHDIDFHYCGDALEAVNVAKLLKPTVILQDLIMPGMDGFDLVRAYRAEATLRDIPIIVLSTTEDPAAKSAAFSLGVDDYLVKLPDKIELLARVRHHSRAYLNQLQRDDAYRALRKSQQLLLEKNLELERLTGIETLTGLSNRKYFDDFMEAQWRRAIRESSAFSILMIDIDNFKAYNDTYGHVAGDEILKFIGNALVEGCRRPTDLPARFGGDEFVVALAGTAVDTALALSENILESIRITALPHPGPRVAGSVTVSIGCATMSPRHGDSYVELLEAADAALYEAKRAGKNRIALRTLVSTHPVRA